MVNSQELNNKRTTNDIQSTKQESKDSVRINQINGDSPEILTNPIYTPAFLRSQIGKLMRIEFLIGTNNMTDRIGFLEDVGASYILLRSFEGDSQIYADIYSIKFITISCNYSGIAPYQSTNNTGIQNWNVNSNMYRNF